MSQSKYLNLSLLTPLGKADYSPFIYIHVHKTCICHFYSDVEALGSVVMEFSVDNSRWSYETIQFLEHVVLSITLEVKGYGEEYEVDDFFTLYQSVGNNTEELVAWLTDQHPRRGDVEIELTSPQNTTSTLLPYREFDFVNAEGYKNWPFMTVHSWGENPNGVWTLRITYKSASGYVHVGGAELQLYGTSYAPESVRGIPSQCDDACSRGCWGEGPSKCDICKQLRVDSTLECVEVCPPGYTEYNSYCLCDNCDSGDLGDASDGSDSTRGGEAGDNDTGSDSGESGEDRGREGGDNNTESDGESSDGGEKQSERDSGGDSVQWKLSLILSSIFAALILVFLVIVCYLACKVARHKNKQTSFTRLWDNGHVVSSV